MGDQQEKMLIQKISDLYGKISKLQSLSPSEEVNALFTELVHACIPPNPIDVSNLNESMQKMRAKLITLCSEAESQLESHYSDLLSTYENPLDHLELFPYFSNYLKLSQLEHALLSRHMTAEPARVAFVGSGPLPMTSLVLATRHIRNADFHNYDISAAANERARRLVRADAGVAARMAFHTCDVMAVGQELGGYEVVFLAALVGVGREEKRRVIEHLACYMAPGAKLVVRSAHGARGFLYPVVGLGLGPDEDLRGFEVMSVYHPTDEVINSVVVARKPHHGPSIEHGMAGMTRPCKCCRMKARRDEMSCCAVERADVSPTV